MVQLLHARRPAKNKVENPNRLGEMAQWVKVFAMQTWRLEFHPRDPHKGGRKEVTSDLHTCDMAHVPTHNHKLKKKNSLFRMGVVFFLNTCLNPLMQSLKIQKPAVFRSVLGTDIRHVRQ